MNSRTTPARILIVDDEPSVVEVVSLYLKREGYLVQTSADGRSALDAIEAHPPTLMVLDLMLPEVDGLEIIRRLRDQDYEFPIIVLSAKREEIDRIYGLELGADDYLTKPFSPAELVARIKAVLRRSSSKSNQQEQPLVFGESRLVLDPLSRDVTVSGEKIELTATEFNLLWFVGNHPNQVFSRDQLLENVWGFSDYVDPSTVTVHIRRLREKIENDPSKPDWLLTVWGVGYKFDPND